MMIYQDFQDSNTVFNNFYFVNSKTPPQYFALWEAIFKDF